MNKDELLEILEREGIRRDAYDLDGGCPNERYCLEASHGTWSVYYSERGLKSGRREFATDNEACEYLLQILRRDPSTKT